LGVNISTTKPTLQIKIQILALRREESVFDKHIKEFFIAAHNKSMETIREMVCDRKVVGINTKNENGEIVLMISAQKAGNDANVRYLVENLGADVDAVDNNGWRASDHARHHNGSRGIIAYLRLKEKNS
jgi:hypothetical protein